MEEPLVDRGCILDYNSKEKPVILESDSQPFETIFKDVFLKYNSLNEDEEVENINTYENMYYIKNEVENFLSAKDKEDVKINANPLSHKKIGFENEKNDFINSSISLKEEEEEEEEEDSHSNPLSTIKTNSIVSKKSTITDQGLQKTPSTTDISRTIFTKASPFQVYKSTEFNIFHPGGKVPLFQKLKNEIKEIDDIKQPKQNIICKFKVKKKCKKSSKNSGFKRKRKRELARRKCKPDNIRKKIKSRFFKAVKNRINQILKNSKSKYFFDLLPQCFIINITKKKNQPIMKMPFKNLLTYDFISEELREGNNNRMFIKYKRIVDIKKYNTNLRVMEYLENNPDIVKRSKFDIISNMTVTQMFKEYLKSDEFEKEIVKLEEEEGDDANYIKDYITKAFGYVNYFH